jgi:Fic family protein
MTKLTIRQQKIVEFIKKNPSSSNSAITKHIKEVSRFTIIRDLDFLLTKKIIAKQGSGRNITYTENEQNPLLTYFDVDNYFKNGPDERDVPYKKFNFDIFNNLKNIFTKSEESDINRLNKKYQNNIKKLSTAAILKDYERLTIELSWKSSQIEGNTYSLIDTEVLIEENQEASGHKKEEATMLLNHKKALDLIWQNKKRFKTLDLRDIEYIHGLLVHDLNVSKGLRKRIVGITGTVYKPLNNQYQIKESLEKTVRKINQIKNPVSKAILTTLMISYIQPFEDGNKRTTRIVANAILLANKHCPLSLRSVDPSEYKKAILLFYEQNNINYFKQLFIEQYQFAVENYFGA